MRATKTLLSTTLIAVVAFGLLAGCSQSDSLPNSVPVRGIVRYNGQLLSHGTVRFAPADAGGQPATGKIQDGAFSMSTTRSSPGVVRGAYRVSILSQQEATATIAENTPPDPNDWPEPESLIPRKYTDIRTSGLELQIDQPVDDLQFELSDE